MVTYIFPGQGSQALGMGQTLFAEFPDITEKADAILGYSIQTLCTQDPHKQLNQTQYTQPALYTVNALMHFKKMRENNFSPSYFAGHSLGEYNALLAAEVFNFETGLRLVKKRGELMSQATDGAMAAIIGLKAEVIKTIFAQHGITNAMIANDNSHTQIVISGQKDAIQQAQIYCEQAGASMVIPLKVSGAFHSPYMSEAQKQFAAYLKEFNFSSPRLPVIANYTARPYLATDIPNNLAQQMTNPVRWTETIEYLIGQGETEFEETGPGMVLTGLVRRIKNGQ